MTDSLLRQSSQRHSYVRGTSGIDFRDSALGNVRSWTYKRIFGGLVYALLDVAEAVREHERGEERRRER